MAPSILLLVFAVAAGAEPQTPPEMVVPAPPGQVPLPRKKQPPAPPEDDDSDISVPEQGPNERLVGDIAATTGVVTLTEVVDEILADMVAELAGRTPKKLSPMAIRNVRLSSNVQPTYARELMAAIIANIHAGTNIRIVECLECQATRSRIVGDAWVISRGVNDAEEVRRVAARLGARSFMDVAFGFDPESGVVQMDFSVVRADDSIVIWADSFRADKTTPMLLRSTSAPQKRKDRLKDLEMLLEGRPFYGFAVTFGAMLLPYDDPVNGDIGGATAGFRVYERFGVDRQWIFGLDVTGFINTTRLAGGILSAGAWWIPIRPDFINPELRVGAKAGAFVAGSEGNAAVGQVGAELLLRYRFGLYGYLVFMTKSQFNNNNLGGLGFTGGMLVSW
jgi:hypothetical protein